VLFYLEFMLDNPLEIVAMADIPKQKPRRRRR
jgi:hypothetical protein